MRTLVNPGRDPGLITATDDAATRFHRGLPGYAPTPLLDAPALAAAWRVGRVMLKLELERFGLPAFKFLGASWAAERLLDAGERDDLVLVAATEGNHGRAVAHVARMRGLAAQILVPAGTAAARIAAIEAEGAQVQVVDGDYDDAVRAAAALAGARHRVLADTSWPGYEEVPRHVVEGYATIFREAEEQGAADPDVLVVPIGVGSLAAAAVRHHRRAPAGPRIAAVEPDTAACALESARAGHPVATPGPHRSIMAGLNCGSVSPIAWPDLQRGIDLFCAIEDDLAEAGMRRLASLGVAAGECSGGTLGAAGALLADPGARAALGARASSRVLLILSEGVTDPVAYARVIADG